MSGDSDPDQFDERRRRLLQGLAATGVGLAGAGGANALTGTARDGGNPIPDPFYGFDHATLGDASAGVVENDLVVADPGGGGVTANVGESEAFITETGFDADVEVGAYREFVGRGVVDGEPGQPVGSARITRVDGELPLALEPDFTPVGAEGFGLEVYQAGDLVHQGEYGYTPNPLDPPELDIFDVVVEWVWTGAGWKLIIRWELDIEIWPPDDDGIVGDEIHVYPLEPQVQLGPVTDVDALGEGLSEFHLDSQRVGLSGHEVEQVGDAQLHPVRDGSVLGVTGIEEDDGVAVSIDGEGFRPTMAPTELPANGSRLAGRPRATVDGVDQPLGEVGFTREDDLLVLDGEFTPLETEALEVAVFRGEEILDELVVEAGQFGYVDGDALLKNGLTWPWPRDCPPLCPPWPPWPPWPPCVEFGFAMQGDPMPLPLNVDGETFEADRVRVRAYEPGLELDPDRLSATEILGTNLEELVLHDQAPRFG